MWFGDCSAPASAWAYTDSAGHATGVGQRGDSALFKQLQVPGHQQMAKIPRVSRDAQSCCRQMPPVVDLNH